MKIFTKLIVFAHILLLISIFCPSANSQIDNSGREFFFTFMPNWHTGNNVDVLYVFVTSKNITKGKIEYTSRFGVKNDLDFSINFPGQIRVFSFDPREHELRGQNDGGLIDISGQDAEMVRQTSFHLTSDQDVTVVIHNEAFYTSDACLVYPKDGLGQNYFVFSYQSNFHSSPSLGNHNTPSQFVVVGTEDNTNVTIVPSSRTFRYEMETQNITLNKGEVYLVQSNVLFGYNPKGSYDLTGSRVTSDKPVAVFGGHQRANIPYTEFASRDYLLSQMIPLESWGRDVFIVPFYQPGSIDNPEFDISKLTVAYDDTEISIAGEPFMVLNKGEAIIQEIKKPIYVTGDKPIRACIFKKSSQTSTTPNSASTSSDPFMVLFPPKDQFLREYNFLNVDLPENYNAHFVNIIIPTVSIPSILLDGNPINANFQPIEGIEYSYANLQVTGGAHNIVADTNFGICVYGYGRTNSYGYVGGLGLDVLDWTPPAYSNIRTDCYNSNISFTEQNKHDTGLDSIVVNEIVNLNYSITDSTKTNFDANLELIDRYQDGYIDFYAIDSSGSKSKDTVIIEGFTFTLNADINNSSFSEKTVVDTINFNTTNCFDLTLTNYGIVEKDISNLRLKDGTKLIKSTTPTLLGAGESVNFKICYESNYEAGWVRDTLLIDNDCFSEEIGFVNFYQRPDINRPATQALSSVCGETKILAQENFDTDYGFGDYEKIEIENLNVELERKNEKEIALNLSLIDPNKDGLYTINFKDRGGNDTTISGIIQGFTANFVLDAQTEIISYETQSIGNSKCLDIMIENNGLLPLTLDDILLSNREYYFIPQSQLPLTVMPDSVVPFTVCFYDKIPSEQFLEDDLIMTFNCLDKKVKLNGLVEEIIIEADSRCEFDLTITFGEVNESLTIDNLYPNPAASQINMQLNVGKNREMTIDLVNTSGVRYRMLKKELTKGLYDFDLKVSDLPSGNYFLQINSEGKRLTKKVVIRQ